MKKLPAQVIILGAVSLFMDVASEMLYPVTPIFLTAVLGGSMALVGAIEGFSEFMAGLLKGYSGYLSDKMGCRSIFIHLGYGLSALSKPLPGIFPFVAAVIGSRLADRAGKGIRAAPRDALLSSYSAGNSGAIFGFHRGMDTLGAALGPLAALALLHFYPDNFQLIFLLAFIPSGLAAGLTFLLKDKAGAQNRKLRSNYAQFWKSAPAAYKKVLLLVVIFSLVNSSDVFLILKSKAISASSTLAILGYVFYNIIYALSSFPLGGLADKYGKKNIFAAGLFVFSGVYFGFALAPDLRLIWLLFALYGIYAAATEGVAKAWISDLIAEEARGTALGLFSMCVSFAVMLGSFLAGLLWDAFGSTVPFMLSAGVSLIIGVAILAQKPAAQITQ